MSGRCVRTEIAVRRVELHARRLRGGLVRFGVAPGTLRRWLRGLVVRRRHWVRAGAVACRVYEGREREARLDSASTTRAGSRSCSCLVGSERSSGLASCTCVNRRGGTAPTEMLRWAAKQYGLTVGPALLPVVGAEVFLIPSRH